MLRKLIAKIRDSIAPSSKKKPQSGSSTKTSTPHREHDRKRGDRPAHASKSGERTHAAKSAHERPSHEKSSTERSGQDKPAHEKRSYEPRQSSGHGRSSRRSEQPRTEGRPGPHPTKAMDSWSALPSAPVVAPQDNAFTKLGLSDALALAVTDKGYTEPTPIQTQAIPIVLTGRDVLGSAQTGTGKTAAFALPVLQRLGEHGPLRCLVLEPTRELALQVEQSFLEYSKHTNLLTTVVYGGVGYGKQTEALHRGMDILVATPGRLLDHLEQRTFSLRGIQILVLDEVDRMLDMGFLPDVKRIIEKCPEARQTLFFSATLPPEIARLASFAVKDPLRIEIGARRSPAETVAHAFYPVVEAQKFDLLQAMLARTNFDSVLVFCRTKVGADRVAAWLKGHKHSVSVMHSDRNMNERAEALAGFKSGKYEVLVATDIAARGLDIAGVTHVINYDVPENPEDYVHRIGRTGRAQKTGEAFTIVGEDDVRHARSIERYISSTIERKRLDNFEYTYSALFDPDSVAAAATKPVSRMNSRNRR